MALEIIAYPFSSGPTPIVWVPLTAADFVSTTPITDPNSIVNNPISIHASNGNITFDLAEKGTAYDGMGEGAAWRLNWPAAWTGGGEKGLIWRVTPQTNPAVTSAPMFCLGYCDRGGDPTNANARAEAYGAAFADAVNAAGAVMHRTSGSDLYPAAFANGTRVCGWYMPGGDVGDETNVGAQPYIAGGSGCVVWDPTALVSTGTLFDADQGYITDGLYPMLCAGFDSTGVGTFTATVRFEWAVIDILPTNSYP